MITLKCKQKQVIIDTENMETYKYADTCKSIKMKIKKYLKQSSNLIFRDIIMPLCKILGVSEAWKYITQMRLGRKKISQ